MERVIRDSVLLPRRVASGRACASAHGRSRASVALCDGRSRGMLTRKQLSLSLLAEGASDPRP